VLNLTAWWLTTRVLDDNGFRDVITKSAQRPAVRSYIAEQATLRFAKSNKLVTAARPVVSKAVAEAIGTPPVTQAIHAFAAGAHSERRAKVAAATASATIRSTLQSIDPALAEKLPDTR
jgi:hypothetical protein